jgi:4'-phosphopantetheinyl transferase
MNSHGEPPCEVVLGMVRTARFVGHARAARVCKLLSTQEREVLARLRPTGARRDYVAAHVLARMLVADVLGVDPAEVRMRAAPERPPELTDPPSALRLGISLSHADGIAICAVAAGCAVGVDVESLRNAGPDPLGVAETICSEAENATLLAAPASQRVERFLTIWTSKEAVAKAAGLGFRLPMVQITVPAGYGGPRAVELGPNLGLGIRWSLGSLRLTPDHVAAFAVRGPTVDQVVVRLQELVDGGRTGAEMQGEPRWVRGAVARLDDRTAWAIPGDARA